MDVQPQDGGAPPARGGRITDDAAGGVTWLAIGPATLFAIAPNCANYRFRGRTGAHHSHQCGLIEKRVDADVAHGQLAGSSILPKPPMLLSAALIVSNSTEPPSCS